MKPEVHSCNTKNFERAFDRTYSLGKQSETITQEEIEKAAEKYDDKHTEQLIHDMDNDSTSWKPLQDGIRESFKAGAQFALGKQEKVAEGTVINGWLARDDSGSLNVFDEEPTRYEKLGMWSDGLDHFGLPYSSFPDLTWESEPQEVEIIFKRKKK